MIKINLLGEKEDLSAMYALQLLGFVAMLVLVVAIGFVVRDTVKSRVDELSDEKTRLEREYARLEKETKRVEELEKKRKTLGEKLRTIALLKSKKHGPIHILDDLNTAIPERSWLLDATQKGGTLELHGIALDNQTVALFMENMKSYPYFGEVELKGTNDFIKDGISLSEYAFSVKLRDLIGGKPALPIIADPKLSETAEGEGKTGKEGESSKSDETEGVKS